MERKDIIGRIENENNYATYYIYVLNKRILRGGYLKVMQRQRIDCLF